MSCECEKKNCNHERGESQRSCKRVTDDVMIAGAKFELRSRCGCLIACGRTNGKGECHFGNLPNGTYILTETEAPDGWLCETKKCMVEVNGCRECKFVEFINSKDHGCIEVKLIGHEEKFVCDNDEDCDDNERGGREGNNGRGNNGRNGRGDN